MFIFKRHSALILSTVLFRPFPHRLVQNKIAETVRKCLFSEPRSLLMRSIIHFRSFRMGWWCIFIKVDHISTYFVTNYTKNHFPTPPGTISPTFSQRRICGLATFWKGNDKILQIFFFVYFGSFETKKSL